MSRVFHTINVSNPALTVNGKVYNMPVLAEGVDTADVLIATDLIPLTDRVTVAEGEIDTLQSTDVTHAGQITALQSADTAHDTQIAALQSADTAHDTQIAALQSADTAHDTQIAALQSADTAHDGQIAALQSADAAHDTQIAALQSADTAHDTQIAALQSADAVHDTRLATAETAIATKAPSALNHYGVSNTVSREIVTELNTAASGSRTLFTYPTQYNNTVYLFTAHLSGMADGGKYYAETITFCYSRGASASNLTHLNQDDKLVFRNSATNLWSVASAKDANGNVLLNVNSSPDNAVWRAVVKVVAMGSATPLL